jgi:NitT/TauT family transport system permease protein
MTDITEPATPSTEEIEQGLQRGRAQGLRRDRVRGVLYPIGSLIAVLAAWEAATRLLRIPLFLLPPPSVIAEATYRNAGLLASESVVTIIEVAFGFGLSVVVGIPLALAIFLWPPFARTLYPLLISSQAVPKVAVAPLFIVWFGLGLLPKVLIAFLIAFFPVVINTAMGLAAIEPEKIYLARSMGLDPLATFFKIRLPNALPSIFAGLKISITLAVVGAVVGEFVGGQGGLGYLLLIANGSLDTALLFAGLVALTVLGVVFFALVVLLERLVLPAHAIDSAAAARQTM